MPSFAILLGLVAILGDEVLAQDDKRRYIPEADKTLVLTNIIFRHGDRTPEDATFYPNAPYIIDQFFPYNYGELTTKGQARMFKNGRKLRARYGRFLGDIYYTDLVNSSSSDYARTQSSLQSVHAGLFMTYKQNPVPGFFWQAVPYHVYAHPDNVIAIWRAYPDIFLDATFSPPEPSIQELFEYLQAHSGYSNVSYVEAMMISDYTKTSLENGFPVPGWLQAVYPSPLSQLSVATFGHLARGAVQAGGALLLKKITQDAVAKSTGSLLPEARKMFLYSGHDMNVHFTLTALNVWSPEEVDYGAQILLELHDVNGVYGFKIYYDNSYDLPKLLTIPGCESFCALDEFVRLTSAIYDDTPN